MIDEFIYKKYVDELKTHLFGETPFIEIVKNRKNSHRKNRFIIIYLLQSKKVFYYYYDRRYSLDLENTFNKIITALKTREGNPIYRYLIQKLELDKLSSSSEVSKNEISEVFKDLNSFFVYYNKELSATKEEVMN